MKTFQGMPSGEYDQRVKVVDLIFVQYWRHAIFRGSYLDRIDMPSAFSEHFQMKKELLWTDTGRNEMTVLLDEYDRRNWEGGFKEGRNTVNHELFMLTSRLVADDRRDDIPKISMDLEYRSKLLAFYFPDGVPAK